MQPTEILMEEHRVIEQVLTCLEKIAAACEGEGQLDTESATHTLDFFRVFADRCHHGKEESLLFPMLEAKGFSADQGPTGVMRTEHDEGRYHVGAMAEAIDAWPSDQQQAGKRFVEHSAAFVRLMRDHIQKEDHCLFPMANQALTDGDQQQLLQSFQKTEQEDLGLGTHAHYLKLAQQLAERYKVPDASGTSSDACCRRS